MIQDSVSMEMEDCGAILLFVLVMYSPVLSTYHAVNIYLSDLLIGGEWFCSGWQQTGPFLSYSVSGMFQVLTGVLFDVYGGTGSPRTYHNDRPTFAKTNLGLWVGYYWKGGTEAGLLYTIYIDIDQDHTETALGSRTYIGEESNYFA